MQSVTTMLTKDILRDARASFPKIADGKYTLCLYIRLGILEIYDEIYTIKLMQDLIEDSVFHFLLESLQAHPQCPRFQTSIVNGPFRADSPSCRVETWGKLMDFKKKERKERNVWLRRLLTSQLPSSLIRPCTLPPSCSSLT